MRLSKFAYYSDFGIYALAIFCAILWAITGLKPGTQLEALAAVVVGVALWTLAEYALHRFVLHGDSPFAKLHARHHAEPNAYIGTPTWLSAGIILGLVFLPAWLIFSMPVAAGLSVGFASAFLWYGIAHHRVHHRPLRSLAPFMQADGVDTQSAERIALRIDGGTAYSGAVVTRWYDPLLEKVTAWASTPRETQTIASARRSTTE